MEKVLDIKQRVTYTYDFNLFKKYGHPSFKVGRGDWGGCSPDEGFVWINAKKLGIINRSKFSLNAMTKELDKILDKYVPEFPKEVQLNLPKLKKVSDSNVEPTKIKLPKLKKV